MNNLIALNRDDLEISNYIRKSKASFFGVYQKRNTGYLEEFETDFNLIIYIDEDIEYDYYIIPYSFLVSIFAESALDKKRNRWYGHIRSHIMTLGVSKYKVDISRFYGIPYKISERRKIEISIPDIADYSIENAKREIEVRLGQSKFRKSVLKRFGSKCCLTGIDESDLLVASHIIPWADNKNRRLDPTNGLCLFTLYDQLFDKGYFTVNEDGYVQISESRRVSKGLKKMLLEINGKKLIDNSPNKTCKEALAYHRENIFSQ